MRKLVLLMALTLGLASVTMAAETSKGSHPVNGSSSHSTAIREHTHEYDRADLYKDHIEAGVKLDAPDLIILTDDWSVGMESSKDFNSTEWDEGWAVYAKVTFKGNLFDFRKDEE